MYFSESKTTANNNVYTSSTYWLPDCLQEKKVQLNFTSHSAVPTLSNIGINFENDESAPIRFSFEELSNMEMDFDMFEEVNQDKPCVTVGENFKKTQVFMPQHKHQEICFDDPAEDVSPNTPKSPNGAMETKSSVSKDWESTMDFKAHSSNIFEASKEPQELVNIFQIISSSETDLNKYVEDLIFESNQEWEQIIEHKVEVTKNNQKRMRKSAFQVKILEQELKMNPIWTKEDIREVCLKSGLGHSQVYKWYWDQQRKAGSKRSSL